MARRYEGTGVSEVHIVGGVHPRHGLDFYAELIRRIRAILPNVVIKAFTAVELREMIRMAGLTIPEGLKLLREAGMGAIPGGGAEIFDAEVRDQICPE